MPKIVPKQTLEEIRFRNEISELIGSYITIKRAGTNFKALCPFHKEKTPSFSINTQRQSFKCFGCGEGGDAFGFIMRHEGVEFMDAVRMLAERAGIPIELEEGTSDGPNKRTLLKIHEELSRFYQRCLNDIPAAQHARDYVRSRDLGGAVAEEFLIGYAPDSWDAVLRWGAKHKYSVEDLEACGLVVASDRPDARNKHYDRFRDRLMFPIHDGQGRVIGFSGRTLTDEARGAKYVNSPETPLFRKSRVLYGLNRARRPIVEAREAILCEGQIDVIKCHMAGFDTAVAAQGTAFTEDHARALRHYADSVKLLFDADSAGQDAAMKTAGLLIAFEFEVSVVRMPPGHDPDSLIGEKGAAALRAVLDCAGSSVAFQIEVLSERERERNAGGGGRLRVASAVLQTIARASKEVQKEQLLQEAAERLNVSVAALRADMKSVKPVPLRAPQAEQAPHGRPAAQGDARPVRPGSGQRAAPQPPPGPNAAAPRTEVALCEFLAQLDNDAAVLAEVKRYLPFDVLNSVDCRRLATACVRSAESGEPVMGVLAEIGEISESLQRLSTSVLDAPMKVKGEAFSRTDVIRDIILDLWRRKLKRDRAALHAIPDAEISKTDATRREQLTQDLIALRNWDEAIEAIELILEEQI